MEKIVSALKEFYSLVEEFNQNNPEKIFWILTWSVALAIQWVDLVPNEDIDILTNEKWAKKLDELLSKYVIKKSEYSSTEKYRSFFWIYKVNWVQIEVMWDFQYIKKDWSRSKENQNNKLVNKNYNWMNLPMLELEQELEEYENMWRIDKAEKIKERLNSSKVE